MVFLELSDRYASDNMYTLSYNMLDCILLVCINGYANKKSRVIHVFSYIISPDMYVHSSDNLKLMGWLFLLPIPIYTISMNIYFLIKILVGGTKAAVLSWHFWH